MEPDGPTVELRELGLDDIEVVGRSTRFAVTEIMRAVLALTFAFFLLIVIVWGFLLADSSAQIWEQTRQLLDSLVPTITALLGSAVGFYFGTQKSD